MQRNAMGALQEWLNKAGRKPLVLRGARQVGKTWLVRELAKVAGLELVEVNFERQPLLAKHFSSNEPQRILNELSLALSRDITAGGALLLLDEVQAAREVLGKLRWFAEELPQLAVIATGSLLDFALRDEGLSMPVGRVE